MTAERRRAALVRVAAGISLLLVLAVGAYQPTPPAGPPAYGPPPAATPAPSNTPPGAPPWTHTCVSGDEPSCPQPEPAPELTLEEWPFPSTFAV